QAQRPSRVEDPAAPSIAAGTSVDAPAETDEDGAGAADRPDRHVAGDDDRAEREPATLVEDAPAVADDAAVLNRHPRDRHVTALDGDNAIEVVAVDDRLVPPPA